MEAPCFIFGCYILLLGDAAGRRARGATGAVQLGAPHNLQNHPHASRRRTLQVQSMGVGQKVRKRSPKWSTFIGHIVR